jgi:hypothetical protein
VEKPLSALMSQVLVAFTIELDNEFERRMPHTTTRGPQAHSKAGPWLVSLPMWANYLRWLPGDVTDLAPLVNLNGLHRWGYLTRDGDLSRAGRRADAIWATLPEEVEARWTHRYGDLGELRAALGEHPDLPPYLPVSGLSRVDRPVWIRDPSGELVFRLAGRMLALTLAYEQESRLPLALAANVLRVLDPDGVRIRDLPALAGVAKEQVEQSVSRLVRLECAEVADRVVRPTAKGTRAQAKYRRVAGGQRDDRLRAALEHVLADPDRLRQGLATDGWRAHPPYAGFTAAEQLPWAPIVSHRGGFPDGS